jgi:hypothetical protein
VKNKHENHVVINYVCKFDEEFSRLKKEFIIRRKPSDCHHPEREAHLCHFNECPDCKQQCNLPLKDCSHVCPVVCHDSVLVKEEINASNTPWGIKEKEKFIKKSLPCPPCQVPTTVSCFGHHTVGSKCSMKKISHLFFRLVSNHSMFVSSSILLWSNMQSNIKMSKSSMQSTLPSCYRCIKSN